MLVEAVLQKYNIPYTPYKGGEEFKINCPNPKHIDNDPSCYINAYSGLFHCFSCQFGGNLARFVKLITGEYVDLDSLITIEDKVRLQLQNLYKISTKSILKYDIDADFYDTYRLEKQNFKSVLKSKKAYKYLTEERKFTIETIKKFNLRYCFDGQYNNRIIITYKSNGNVIGFNSRFIGDCSSTERYRYFLNDIRFKNYLYNIENIVNHNYCIIVEGPFDLMYMEQMGFKNVISTLNTRLTDEQILTITDFRNIIFCYDNDIESKAGQKARVKNATKLLKLCPNQRVHFMNLPEGKDPNSCSKIELVKAWNNKYKVKLEK